MHLVLEQPGVPEQREIVENGVVFGERHVMRQAWAGQRDVDVVHQVVVLVDDAVVHVRVLLAVVEEQQLAGPVVHLGMRRYAPVDGKAAVPGFGAQRVPGIRVHAVQVAALVEAGQRDPAVHDDVSAGRVLHQFTRTPALFALGELHRLGQSRPQRPAGLVLGEKTLGLDEPIAVEGLPVPEAHHVQHAVAVEGVIGLERWVQRVLGVTQVDAVQVAREFACHHGQVVGVPLRGLRTPRAGPVGMVVVFRQRG